MFAKERKREILKILQSEGKIRTLELAERFSVSEPTIRRDINELDEKGLLVRTHGGAISVDIPEREPSFDEKVDRLLSEKEQIGRLAASMIREGDSVLLDTGTTTLMIARYLKVEDVTVLTNSLDIAYELEKKPNVEIIITGGSMRWNTRAMVGPVAESSLERFRVDIAFVGANAISLKDGISTPNLIEADVKRKMIHIARKAFLVADHSKFEKSNFSRIAGLTELSGIITDPGLDPALLRKYEAADVEIILEAGAVSDIDSDIESGSRPDHISE